MSNLNLVCVCSSFSGKRQTASSSKQGASRGESFSLLSFDYKKGVPKNEVPRVVGEVHRDVRFM
jgi:hypothetical protein